MLWNLRRGGDVLALPFLFGGFAGYVYGVMAWVVHEGWGRNYLPERAFELGQMIAAISIAAFLLGWVVGRRNKHSRGRPANPPDPYVVWRHARFWLMVGFVTYFFSIAVFGQGIPAFYSQSHNAGAPAAVMGTAYLWNGRWFAFSGLMLAMASLALVQRRRKREVITIILAAGLLGLHVLTQGKRGPSHVLFVVLVFAPFMAGNRKAPKWLGGGAIFASGLAIVLLVAYRGTLNFRPETSPFEHKPRWTTVEETTNNSYLLHSRAALTFAEYGDFRWGGGFLFPILHLIPRIVWPDKPTYSDMGGNPWDRADEVAPVGAIGRGRSYGGFAAILGEAGIFFPLFWLILGLVARRLYDDARLGGSLAAALAYTSLAAVMHWLIGQGLRAAIVPFAYLLFPVITYWLATKRRRVGHNRRPLLQHSRKPCRLPSRNGVHSP